MHKSLLMLGFCLGLGSTANAQPASGYSTSGYATPAAGAPSTAVYRNERFGFQLTYPATVFDAQRDAR